MSVSIEWKPVVFEAETVEGGHALLSALNKAFGELPREFSDGDIQVLMGIAACGHKGAEQLADAIHKHGRIMVEAGY